MTELTTAEKDLIRTRPHRTKLWLSIYQPKTVFSAQVNNFGSAQGDRDIFYDGLITGSSSFVNEGMTMYVGSSAGASDKGRIRVRSISGAATGTVSVAENSYINWEDNDYLTIVSFYEIVAKYPRIIQDPGDPTKTLWYKDYDIVYTDQNTIQGAFPCMGSHFAGFIEDDGDCNVFYSASGSSHVIPGTSLSFFWTFEGSTTPSGTGAEPGYIPYTTPGHYTTSLLVSGSNGSSDLSYRHVSIYKRPETSTTDVPILKWELEKLNGSHESGGYTATIRMLQDVPETEVRDGSLVVIYADDWYGTTKQSIGGNSKNRQSIVFVGYILNGTIRFNWKSKEITFDVGSPTEMMKLSDSFSVSIEDIDDPVAEWTAKPEYYVSPWTLLVGMNVKKAIHHYLKWHSTVLYCCDFQFLGTDQLIQYFDADRESLFAAINTLMRGALYGALASDRQGNLWAETEIYTESPRNINTFLIDDEDWVGDPIIEEMLVDRVSYLESGGIVYPGFSGTTAGTSIPVLSAAPGTPPGYRGEIQRFQGLALASQSQLNTLVGSIYAYMNRKYPRIDFTMAGNYRFFDVAPQERISISIPAAKNPRQTEIAITTFPNQVSFSYDPKRESFQSKIYCSEIPTSMPGTTITIPEIPPTSNDNGIGFSIPPINIPPIVIGGGGAGDMFVPAVGGITDDTGTALIVGAFYNGTAFKQMTGGNGGICLSCPTCGLYAMNGPSGWGSFAMPAGKSAAKITPIILGWPGGTGYFPNSKIRFRFDMYVYPSSGASSSQSVVDTLEAEDGSGLVDCSSVELGLYAPQGSAIALVGMRDTANMQDNLDAFVFLFGWSVTFL